MAQQPHTPRRGDVYDCQVPAGDAAETVTVVVVSRDDWNMTPPDDRIWAVPIKRHERPLAVRLTDADPIGGWVQIHGHGMNPRTWLTTPVAMLSGATMQKIREAFATLQEDTEPTL